MAKADLPDEAQAFLEKYPDTEIIDLLVPDMNGVLRGKQIPVEDIGKMYDPGISYPGSSNLLDTRGAVFDNIIYGSQDGDPDMIAKPVPGTLTPVPWAPRPTAQCLLSMYTPSGDYYTADTRAVLVRAQKHFEDLGLTPVIAIELEFYLLDASTMPPTPAKPPVLYPAMRGAQCYNLDNLYDFEAFLGELDKVCKSQSLPANSTLCEYGDGQFEVNLRHREDPAAACDEAVLLKRAVKGVARRQGLLASFMAKPFADQPGNGLHVHLSVYDKDGRNIFAGTGDKSPYSEKFRHAVGGVLQTMGDGMAIFAPNANSYRRFRPGMYVPLTPNWGPNHRGVSVRIPVSTAPDTRLEHRLAGADANPYLVTSAVLAGVHHGLTQGCDPGPMVREGTVLGDPPATLPLRLEAALDAFERSTVLGEFLGKDYAEIFAACRRGEAERFHAEISDRDYDWYLRTT